MCLSFLVLSDIHFGRYAATADFVPIGTKLGPQISNAAPMRNSLIETAAHCKSDSILVPGDLTSIGAPAEFQGAVAFTRDVAARCNVRLEDTFFTFGNHDANWRVSRLAEESDDFQPDSGYTDISTRIGGLLVTNPSDGILGPFPGSGLFVREKYDLLVLNTGAFCSHEQNFAHGKIGAEQLDWARNILAKWESRGRWKIVMLHHHTFSYPYPTPGPDISVVEEAPELLEAFGKAGVDLVCHGHRHHPRICTRMETGWQHAITFFCAGSTAVTPAQRNNGEIPNLFHVASLKGRGDSGQAVGSVDTFRYTTGEGWIRPQRSSQVPLDSPQIFGSYATDAERRTDAVNWLTPRRPGPAKLPAFAELPLSLQCMPWSDLKSLLQEVGAGLGCDLAGAYPEDTVILPKET
jgi:3',5'-cyclic AMP phosphodiesterase CpdA